jgi:hypothetical protein
MAISAVQICVLTALALVPRNDFTFAVCFSALAGIMHEELGSESRICYKHVD